MSLKAKAFKGLAWNSLESLMVKAASFAVSIVVARLVSPEAYGLIGMLTFFIAISNIFIESGFSRALVQRKDCTQEDFSTVFYFNLAVSLVIYLLLYLAAPAIAAFYRAPELVLLTRVQSLQFIVSALVVVQKAKLLIDIDFKTQAKVNVLAVIISGLISLYLAYNGYGVWALVGQTLSLITATAVLMWFSTKWRPSWIFSWQAFREMFGYGSKLLLAGLYSTTLTNIYTIMIGRWYQSRELGYYTRASTLAEMSSGTLYTIINNVTFPLLTSIKEDRDRLISVYSRLLSMTAFIVFPAMVLFSLIAEPFIRVFLTEKWLPATILLQWLCLTRMFMPISALNLNLLNAVGRSDLFLKTDLSKLPIILLSMVITLPMGTKAVVIGGFITTFISYFINAYLPGKLYGYGAFKQIKDCFRIIACTLVMSIVSYLSMQLLSSPASKLIIGISTAGVSYLLACYALKVKELQEFFYVLNKARNRNN